MSPSIERLQDLHITMAEKNLYVEGEMILQATCRCLEMILQQDWSKAMRTLATIKMSIEMAKAA